MADDLGEDGQWRDTMETRLGTLETKVDEQAGLRAAMDEDMSSLKAEFRAQRVLLQALRDTQQEHTLRLDEHTARLERLEAKLERVHVGVDTIIGLLDEKPSASD